ncbi:MAG: HD domain-containing phosphohydrolase [Candidatus Acidiferrales bacterium]
MNRSYLWTRSAIRRYVQHLVKDLHLEESWRYDVAALMSQLGCVSLDPETVEAAYQRAELPAEDAARFNRHPAVARQLISQIPCLEGGGVDDHSSE